MNQANTTMVWLMTVITDGSDNFSFTLSRGNGSWQEGEEKGDRSSLSDHPIISDRTMHGVNVYVNILLVGGVAAFGLVSNVVNMILFWRLGLKDSMSVGLMALSLSDFFHSLLILVSRGLAFWDTFYRPLAFDPVAINYVCFDWVRDILYLASGWITTLLSVERCVCVVFPFKVRQLFTWPRTLGLVVAIFVTHVALYMPAFVTQRLAWIETPWTRANGSVVIVERLGLEFSAVRTQVDKYIDVADGVPIVSQIIVIISVGWMIHGLVESSRLRRSMMVQASHETKDDASGLSLKNKRLVKVVIFLAVIMTVCNAPRFLAAYVRHVEPQVMFAQREHNLFVLLWTVAILFTVINTSVNIFVYLIINSSYRALFKAMFGCRAVARGSDCGHDTTSQ